MLRTTRGPNRTSLNCCGTPFTPTQITKNKSHNNWSCDPSSTCCHSMSRCGAGKTAVYGCRCPCSQVTSSCVWRYATAYSSCKFLASFDWLVSTVAPLRCPRKKSEEHTSELQ